MNHPFRENQENKKTMPWWYSLAISFISLFNSNFAIFLYTTILFIAIGVGIALVVGYSSPNAVSALGSLTLVSSIMVVFLVFMAIAILETINNLFLPFLSLFASIILLSGWMIMTGNHAVPPTPTQAEADLEICQQKNKDCKSFSDSCDRLLLKRNKAVIGLEEENKNLKEKNKKLTETMQEMNSW